MFVLVYFYLVKYQFNNKCRLYIQYNCTIAIHYNFTQNAKEQNHNFWHGCELLQTHLDMNNFSNFFQNSVWLYIELTFWIFLKTSFKFGQVVLTVPQMIFFFAHKTSTIFHVKCLFKHNFNFQIPFFNQFQGDCSRGPSLYMRNLKR